MISGRLAFALADRYRIERELGQGGMATVYLADDLRHDRKVGGYKRKLRCLFDVRKMRWGLTPSPHALDSRLSSKGNRGTGQRIIRTALL